MNCPKCGQPVDQGAQFCGSCGQVIAVAVPTPQPVQLVQPNTVASTVVQPVQTVAPIQPTQTPQVVQSQAPNPASPLVQPASSQQSINHMEQVLVNQQSMPATPVPNFGSPLSVYGAPAAALPVANVKGAPGEKLAIVGLVFSIIALPGMIIPLIGLVFGIVGMVLGTISRSKYKHTMSLLAIIFSGIAIAGSIALIVFAAQKTLSANNPSTTGSSQAPSTSTVGNFESVTTPCFSTQIDQGLASSGKASGACSFDYNDDSEEFTVIASSYPTVTTSNFSSVAKSAIDQGTAGEKGTITSEGSATFAGSPAYKAVVSFPGKQYGLFYYVLHPTSHGENVFFIGRDIVNSSSVSLGPLEKYWKWN